MVLVYHSASIAPSAATGLSPPRRVPATGPATGDHDDHDDPDAFSNLMVSSEFVFDLEAYPPFATAFDVASPCPAPATDPTAQVNDRVVMRHQKHLSLPSRRTHPPHPAESTPLHTNRTPSWPRAARSTRSSPTRRW